MASVQKLFWCVLDLMEVVVASSGPSSMAINIALIYIFRQSYNNGIATIGDWLTMSAVDSIINSNIKLKLFNLLQYLK